MTRDLLRPFVFTVVLAGSALVMTGAPAAAQSIVQPQTWTVTPFIHTSMGVSSPAPNDSIGLGAAVAYDWTANLGFEGEVSHLFDVADTPDIDWSITNFSGNVVYHFDVVRVTPYATFGMGMERSSFTLRNPDALALLGPDPSATEVAINYGGGVKYLLTDRFIARGDLRRFQAIDDAPDYWRLYGGITYVLRR